MKKKGKTNTKTIGIVSVILLLSVVVILYLISQKKQRVSDATPTVTQTQVQTQKEAKEFKTVFVEGVVQGVKDSVITIKNDASSISLNLSESFVVDDPTSGNTKIDSLNDLIKGKKVRVEINQEDSMVFSVKILQ